MQSSVSSIIEHTLLGMPSMGIWTTSSAGSVPPRGRPQKSWPLTSSIGRGKPLATRAGAPDAAAGCEPCGLAGSFGTGVAPGAAEPSSGLKVMWMLSSSSPTLHRKWHRASRSGDTVHANAGRSRQGGISRLTVGTARGLEQVVPLMHVDMTENRRSQRSAVGSGDYLLPR